MSNAQLNPVSIAHALGGEARGNQISAPAPGHSRGDRSLSVLIDPSAPEGFVVTAFAGEDVGSMRDYVRDKAGLPAWQPERSPQAPPTAHVHLVKPKTAKRFSDYPLIAEGYSAAATYDYFDADGVLKFQVLRYEHVTKAKTFLQRQPDGKGGWLGGRPAPLLYRMPELFARPRELVYVVEGEKDADNLASIGALATTVPNGSWPDDLVALRGRKIYVLADNDKTGEEKANKAISLLSGIAIVHRIDLPGLPDKGDVSDWLAAGGTIEQLAAMAKAALPVAANQNLPGPRIISSAELVNGFVPPDYHVDGIAQKGFIYSLTAATGTGKTAVMLLIASLTAEGGELSGREVAKGRVVYFAGENPDDVTMRWIGMAHHLGFDLQDIDVHFIKERFSIPEAIATIREQVEKLDGVGLIIVDTSAAYFHGTDENGNTELGKHARDLRALTTLPGRPCVIVACHPTKNATSDGLLPRGGGAFIAEVDGNLTLAKAAGAIRLHWQGKHRGPDFDPLSLELKTITAPALVDSKGRPIPTVMAQALSTGEVAAIATAARRDEDDVLLELDGSKIQSLAGMAESLGWMREDGLPHKDRVRRACDKLKKEKLIISKARKLVITTEGYQVLTDIRAERHRESMAAEGASRIVANAIVRNAKIDAHDFDDD